MRQPAQFHHLLAALPTWRGLAVFMGLVMAIGLSAPIGVHRASASQDAAGQEYSPATDPAHVIAQGVVDLPDGDVVWRTVRTRAALPADARFEVRPLGFVLASSGPLLLVDEATGEQTRLGTGEAALVREGMVQQRSSLGQQPVSYLSIELVAANAPPPPADATVLQPGTAFPAPSGLRDLDLLSATLTNEESFTVLDTGAKNVVLITDGAGGVARPGSEPVVLLAGEAASFSGELEVSIASGGADGAVSFVAAMIGPEVSAPANVAAAPAPSPATTEPAAATASPAVTGGAGSITIQIFTCPPGMDAQTIAAAACAPAVGEVAVTLSGEALATPLSLVDASASGNAFTWSGLPYGDYGIVQTVLPEGATTYTLAAANTSGDPESGYQVTIDETTPDLAARIYTLAP